MSRGNSSSPSSSSHEHKTEEKMDKDCDEDEILANFLESEILSADFSTATSTAFEQKHEKEQEKGEEKEEEINEEEKEPTPKVMSSNKNKDRRRCDVEEKMTSSYRKKKLKMTIASSSTSPPMTKQLATTSNFGSGYISGTLSNVPPEIFHNIIKFLSPEDLISCSLVCRFMNVAASDDSLWRRLYCIRWGLASSACKLHTCSWKKLYIQHDNEDMVEFIRNTPSKFKKYYIQMQASKRSQEPLPSEVNDDSILLDKTISGQVSIWKRKRGLSDTVSPDHVCSGHTCTFYQIGDVFLCEKTGSVHVCDDTCREVIFDPVDDIMVCTISGHCFDRLICTDEELDDEQQAGVTDEAEPFLGSGRFARAYLLGYNCADEEELEETLRFC
ncbi:F-box protein SKIP31 [Zostera marina]|uniref:F-box protein SKIP31 n=1 Tax=Zostera marina TaxID=29655 RepID=A0A0K9P1G3_ZOSMR|nr:F-box protein SKIP31 [Zostera marina]